MKSSNKQIAKNTIFLYIRMIVMLGINLFASRVILQALGVEDYGLYNVVGSIVIMFSIINGTLASGTSRFLTYELGIGDFEKLRKTFSASFLLHCAVALFVLILAETVGLWYLNHKMIIPETRLVAANWLYQFSIISCMFSLTQVPYSAIIIAHEKMNIYAWIGVGEAVYKLLVIYLVLYVSVSDKLIFYGFLIMIWSCALQLFYRYYCSRFYRESRLLFVKEKGFYKKILSFSLWDVVGAFCVNGNSQGINLLINMFFGVALNAARAIAYQVENAIVQFANNFMIAVQPQIVKRYAQKDILGMTSLIFNSSKMAFALLLLVSLPIFLETDYILSLWLSHPPAYTSLFLKYILIAQLIRIVNRPVVQAVHATGNIKLLNLLSGGVSIALQLPVIYVLYKIGCPVESCFWVMIVVYLICNYLELICLRKNVEFNLRHFISRVYVKCIILALIASCLPYWVSVSLPQSMLRLFISSLVSILSVSCIFFCWGIDFETRNRILTSIVYRFKHK